MNNIHESTLSTHVFNTIGVATLYVMLIGVVVCIIGFFVAKIIYHIYLNCLLFLYAFSVKSWGILDIISIEESYNILCSSSILNDNTIKYYDLNIVTETCNITAYCLRENVLKNDKISYVTSYIGSGCMYAENIIDVYEMLALIFVLTITFGCMIWVLCRSFVNIK